MTPEKNDILMSKWVAGELSAQQLEQWSLDQSSNLMDNKTAQYEQIWALSADYNPQVSSSEASWAIISKAINTPSVKNSRTRRLWLPMKIAASFLLLMGAWYTYNYIYGTDASDYIITAEHANENIMLNDASMVWLNKGATLSYPNRFDQDSRVVHLTGEAFFDITKSDVPFIIKTNTGEVTVVGTSFEVEANEYNTMVTVATGKVNLSSNVSGKSIFIEPNETGTHDLSTQSLTLSKTANMRTIAWHAGDLAFSNTPLHDVISTLSTFFMTQISITDANMKKCLYTSPLTILDLDKTIEVIRLTYDFDVIRKDGKIVLNNGSCH